MNSSDPERMQCMEVWGGNRSVDRSIETPGLRIWTYCRPCAGSESGGDVYYLSSCASGRITRMLLADVSGHGESVSRIAVGLRDLMSRNVNYISQSRFVSGMNKQFGELSQGQQFATAVVSTFFAPTRSFVLCNAGHPPPLLYRRHEGCWSVLSEEADEEDLADMPLGVLDESSYQQSSVRLDAGDLVLSFSDAITESENPAGEQLGYLGALEMVAALDVNPPETIIPQLLAAIARYDSRACERDDTTILLCEATGGSPPLKNNLLAPFKMFGNVRDNTDVNDPDERPHSGGSPERVGGSPE